MNYPNQDDTFFNYTSQYDNTGQDNNPINNRTVQNPNRLRPINPPILPQKPTHLRQNDNRTVNTDENDVKKLVYYNQSTKMFMKQNEQNIKDNNKFMFDETAREINRSNYYTLIKLTNTVLTGGDSRFFPKQSADQIEKQNKLIANLRRYMFEEKMLCYPTIVGNRVYFVAFHVTPELIPDNTFLNQVIDGIENGVLYILELKEGITHIEFYYKDHKPEYIEIAKTIAAEYSRNASANGKGKLKYELLTISDVLNYEGIINTTLPYFVVNFYDYKSGKPGTINIISGDHKFSGLFADNLERIRGYVLIGVIDTPEIRDLKEKMAKLKSESRRQSGGRRVAKTNKRSRRSKRTSKKSRRSKRVSKKSRRSRRSKRTTRKQ